MLSGYKSYIVGALLIIAAGMHAMGIIDDAWYKNIQELLAGGAVLTFAAKFNRYFKNGS